MEQSISFQLSLVIAGAQYPGVDRGTLGAGRAALSVARGEYLFTIVLRR